MTEAEKRALYDPRSGSLSCGIRAAWLLYVRGRWNILEEIGIARSEWEEVFAEFEYSVMTPHPRRRLYRPEEVAQLVWYCPKILDFAIDATGKYRVLMAEIEKEFA